MISFTVRMKFRPEDRQQVSDLLATLVAASRREPGCVTYVAHTVEGEPDTVVIYEQYRDEQALEAHRASKHFQAGAVAGLNQLMLDREVETLCLVA
ncbi:MAG: putative quinol monooxygenase [Acidobacteriaceae bacterium]